MRRYILCEQQNIFYPAMEDIAQVIECNGADWTIVFEAIQQAATDPVFVDQLIG